MEGLATNSPLLYHVTRNDLEYQEIAKILGHSRRFKISQLRIDDYEKSTTEDLEVYHCLVLFSEFLLIYLF
jgi:hypothetical protein